VVIDLPTRIAGTSEAADSDFVWWPDSSMMDVANQVRMPLMVAVNNRYFTHGSRQGVLNVKASSETHASAEVIEHDHIGVCLHRTRDGDLFAIA
jgi:hypothetical protein